MPFTAPGFLMSFSIPNLHVHASIAYAILRQAGVTVEVKDFAARKLRAAFGM